MKEFVGNMNKQENVSYDAGGGFDEDNHDPFTSSFRKIFSQVISLHFLHIVIIYRNTLKNWVLDRSLKMVLIHLQVTLRLAS